MPSGLGRWRGCCAGHGRTRQGRRAIQGGAGQCRGQAGRVRQGAGAGRPPSDGSGGQCTRQPAAKVQAGSRRRCCRWYLAQGGHATCRKGCKRQVQDRAKAGGRADIFHVRRRRYRRAGPSRGLLCSASIGACGGCPQRGSSRPRRACHRACHQAGRQAFDTAPRTSRRGARQRKTGGQTSSRAAKVAYCGRTSPNSVAGTLRSRSHWLPRGLPAGLPAPLAGSAGWL